MEKNQVQGELIKELGLEGLAPEKQEELVSKMTEAVLGRIFSETVEKLSEADRATYEDMVSKNENPEAVEKFLNEKISGYNELVKKIVEDFKAEMKQE